MINVSADRTGWQAWSSSQAELARARYQAHQERLEREERDNDLRLAKKAKAKLDALDQSQAHSKTEQDEIERKLIILL